MMAGKIANIKLILLVLLLFYGLPLLCLYPADAAPWVPSGPVESEKKDSVKPKGDRSNALFLKIFGDNNVTAFEKSLIIYGNTHLPPSLRKFYFRIVERTHTYPIILLFIFLILVFLINTILVVVVLYLTNQFKNHQNRYIRVYKRMYEEVLMLYLFGEISWDIARIKLKKIKKPLNRKILTSVLFNFQENLRGGMDQQILEIFTELGLQRDAIKSTKSIYYYKRVQGIRQLTHLYPGGAIEIVQDLINNKDDQVRTEVQTSYILLHPLEPFGFLQKLSSPFTRWSQLTGFYLYRMHQLPLPSFREYLNSEQANVRNFSLRMIIYFQQLENAPEIISLAGNPMELTRYLCYRAISDLRLVEAREFIKKRYPVETPKNQYEIIKAFRNIGNADDYEFLESIIKTGTVTAKTEACRSLFFMNPDGKERLALLSGNADLEINHYLDHVTDPRN